MDDRTAMWVRLLAGAMIAIGLLGTIGLSRYIENRLGLKSRSRAAA